MKLPQRAWPLSLLCASLVCACAGKHHAPRVFMQAPDSSAFDAGEPDSDLPTPVLDAGRGGAACGGIDADGSVTVCADPAPPCDTSFLTADCENPSACVSQNGGCDRLVTCSASDAGVRCGVCPEHYAGSGASGCVAVDECSAGSATCGPGTCQNRDAGYQCQCPAGYQGTGTTSCTDLDECAGPQSPCGAGQCTNTKGSYSCVCPSGYAADGGTACVDIDECAGAASPCGSGQCRNLVGGYACQCPAGYTGSGSEACVDVDECASNPCGPGSCMNLPGSYSCACPLGYVGNGTTYCQLLTACAGSNPCAPGSCDDLSGSLACTCPPGYYDHAQAGCSTLCGDGVLAGAEECDDGNPYDADGCSATCVIEPGFSCGGAANGLCVAIPAAPRLDGEASAGHSDVVWTWSPLDANASRIELRVDSGSTVALDPSTSHGYSLQLTPGTHVLHARACNVYAGCSDYAMFTTVVEYFGASYPSSWHAVAKDLPSTALGHTVAISCHNCYEAADQTILDTAAARARIAGAAGHAADFIELDVADIGGLLFATHSDVTLPELRPTIDELLDTPAFAASSSLLLLEIKEADVAPATFADELLTRLDAHREYVHNGRPVLIKGYSGKLAYLLAIRDAAAAHPFLAPYLRFWLLYGNHPIAAWQKLVQDEAASNHLDGIEADYRCQDLFSLLAYARGLGLDVGVFTLPGPSFGEVLLSGLREQVSLLTTEYRADQARAIVEASNGLAYANVEAATDPALMAFRASAVGSTPQTGVTLGLPASAQSFGTPTLQDWPAGQPFYGRALQFEPGRSQAIQLDSHAAVGGGVLLSLLVRFNALDALAPGESQVIVSKPGSFTLELSRPSAGGTSVLRFGVSIAGQIFVHEYPITGGSMTACDAHVAETFTDPLQTGLSYLIEGAYDGQSGVHLFIDHRCAGTLAPAAQGMLDSSAAPIMLGAEPLPAPPFAHAYFDGDVQQLQLQRWAPHAGDQIN